MIEGTHFRNVEARRRTVADAIDRYLLEEVPRKKNGGMHRACLPWWRKRIGHLRLAELSPAAIAAERGRLSRESFSRANPKAKRTSLGEGEQPRTYVRSPATVNRYLAALSHVLTVARREWHWLSHSPFDGVSKLRESRGRIRHLSDAERRKLLQATASNPSLHVLTMLALSTAARAGELVSLKWADIDLDEGRAILRDTKNGTDRIAWIAGDALRLMREREASRDPRAVIVFPGRGGRGRYDYKPDFRAAARTAGLENLKFHDLRHTAATMLAAEGATEQQLRAIGGWKSNVVSRYVHLASTDARGAIEKLAERLAEREAKK